jgi:electron transfer flavoprotein alpha subunit
MAQIFAYLAHKNGVLEDSALELLAAARTIDAAAPVTALVFGSGADLEAAAAKAAENFAQVWKIGGSPLAYPNAEMIRKALVALLPAGCVFLAAHDTFGMDLAPGLSIKLQAAFVPDVVGIDGIDGSVAKLVRQEYGGQVSTHVSCDLAGGAVLTVRGGAFKAQAAAGAGQVVDKSGQAGELSAGRRFVKVVEAEAGDVDITKSDVLVSVGRGIEDKENIGIAEELAEAMGAVVSCSRPIVDAKWLEKARQVGTSGKTVKPKVYMACGISGSFQHMGGLKGSPFIVAINKNAKAPIFQVADVGIVANILEFLPELTEAIKER